MAFKIEPYGGARWKGQYADHRDIKRYLGYRENAKIPRDHEGFVEVPLTDGRTTMLRMYPGKPNPTGDYRGKSSAHRSYVECLDCGCEVPAGRTHQHKCEEQ